MKFRILAAAAVVGVFAVGTESARAITQTAGNIEVSGNQATIDIWSFTLGGALSLPTGVLLTPINGPFTSEDMALMVFTDVGGSIGALIAQDGIAGDADRNARVDFASLAPGNYIAVVSAAPLTLADLGPFQTDPAVSVPITYELTLDLAGGNESIFTCSLEGNLDGSFTKTPGNGACSFTPGTPVPAPASFGLLLAGVVGAAGLGALRRRA